MFPKSPKKSNRRKAELEVISEYSLLEIDHSARAEQRDRRVKDEGWIPEKKNKEKIHRPSPSKLIAIEEDEEDEETEEETHSTLTEVTGWIPETRNRFPEKRIRFPEKRIRETIQRPPPNKLIAIEEDEEDKETNEETHSEVTGWIPETRNRFPEKRNRFPEKRNRFPEKRIREAIQRPPPSKLIAIEEDEETNEETDSTLTESVTGWIPETRNRFPEKRNRFSEKRIREAIQRPSPSKLIAIEEDEEDEETEEETHSTLTEVTGWIPETRNRFPEKRIRFPEKRIREAIQRPPPSKLIAIEEDEETEEVTHSSLTKVTSKVTDPQPSSKTNAASKPASGARTSPKSDTGRIPALRPQTSRKISVDKLPTVRPHTSCQTSASPLSTLRVTGKKVCLQQRQQPASGSAGGRPSKQTDRRADIPKQTHLLPAFAPSKIKAAPKSENHGPKIKNPRPLAARGQGCNSYNCVDNTRDTGLNFPVVLGKKAQLHERPVKAPPPTSRSFRRERLRPT